MSILDSLRANGWLEADGAATVRPSDEPHPPAVQHVVDKLPAQPPAMMSFPTASSVNGDVLSKLMDEVNQSAPPKYAEFQKMLGKMLSIPSMTPAAAYQAAAAATGITKPDVDAAIDHLLQRLSQEQQEYKGVIDNAIKERVDARRASITQMQSDNERDTKQIGDLQMKIAGRTTDITRVQSEIAEESQKIQNGAATFEATAAQVKSRLEQARNEAAQFLVQ